MSILTSDVRIFVQVTCFETGSRALARLHRGTQNAKLAGPCLRPAVQLIPSQGGCAPPPHPPAECRLTEIQQEGGYLSLRAEIFLSHSFRCVLARGGVLHYPGTVRALTLSARACRQTLILPPLLGVPNHRIHALVGHLGPNNDRVMPNPRAYPKRGRSGEPYM